MVRRNRLETNKGAGSLWLFHQYSEDAIIRFSFGKIVSGNRKFSAYGKSMSISASGFCRLNCCRDILQKSFLPDIWMKQSLQNGYLEKYQVHQGSISSRIIWGRGVDLPVSGSIQTTFEPPMAQTVSGSSLRRISCTISKLDRPGEPAYVLISISPG